MAQELDKRLRLDLRNSGDFKRVHPLPQSGADVPDDTDARLVALSFDHPYSKETGNPAEQAAKAIFESRGNTPRLFRNTLVFLAPDATRLQDLDEAVRRYLAWASIVAETVELNLSPHQVKQAETQLGIANSTVIARIPETYQWLLVPVQDSPQANINWQAIRLTGNDALAVRVSKKLKTDELLITTMAGTRLRMELDRVPLWRGNHVPIKLLVEDFARYIYLPRLQNPQVLAGAVRDGLGLILWANDSFAYADHFDEAAGRYVGLRGGVAMEVLADGSGLLVRSDVAQKQLEAEKPAPVGPIADPNPSPSGTGLQPTGGKTPDPKPVSPPVARTPKRFHGTVTLDPNRVGRDAGRIAEVVIAHLVGLVGAKVTVTLEIEAEIPGGTPDQVVRTVTENGRTLKFDSQGFEVE